MELSPCGGGRTDPSRTNRGSRIDGSGRPVSTLGGFCQRVTALVCSTHLGCACRGTIRRMLRSVPTSSSAPSGRTWRLSCRPSVSRSDRVSRATPFRVDGELKNTSLSAFVQSSGRDSNRTGSPTRFAPGLWWRQCLLAARLRHRVPHPLLPVTCPDQQAPRPTTGLLVGALLGARRRI